MKLKIPLILAFIAIITFTISCQKDESSDSLPGSAVTNTLMSNESNQNNPNTSLATPSFTVKVTGAEVTVSWSKVDNAVGYQVVFSDQEGGDENLAGTKTADLTIIRSNVSNGSYTVKVRALVDSQDKSYKHSPWSAGSAVEVTSSTPPVVVVKTKLATPVITVTPNDASATTSGQDVTVSWGADANAASYLVAFGGGPATTRTSPFTITLPAGDRTVTVQAIGSGNFSDSEAGLRSFIVKRKLATPIVSSSVEYSSASITGLTASSSSIWPPNKAMVPVKFSGNVDLGLGTATFRWTADPNAVQSLPIEKVGLAPGTYEVEVRAISANTQYFINSDIGTGSAIVKAGSASYELIDEYPTLYTGQVGNGEVSQVVSCTKSGSFVMPITSVTISLQAWRYGQDKDGRSYTFTAKALNGGGAATTGKVVVIVPHSR